MENVMDFIHKMAAIEQEIAAEKGNFVLFALIKRAEGIGLWDIVISASWFGTDDKKTLDYMTRKFSEKLTPEDMMLISQIVPFPPTDPLVKEILNIVHQRVQQPVMHGHVELSAWTLSSMPISLAYIMTATPPQNGEAASVTFSPPMPPTGETGATRVPG
jgi:hypothetical protein